MKYEDGKIVPSLAESWVSTMCAQKCMKEHLFLSCCHVMRASRERFLCLCYLERVQSRAGKSSLGDKKLFCMTGDESALLFVCSMQERSSPAASTGLTLTLWPCTQILRISVLEVRHCHSPL